jgi:hypothetical protein
MDNHHRDIQIKMRFNRAEADALATLAKAKGISLAATVRQLLHAAASSPTK